ncbi:MAG: hypothetical protein QXU13_01875 [Desulfurococcaceae archaeon]
MVYLVEIDGYKYYACEICGSLYEDMDIARKCEDLCKKSPELRDPELAKQSIGYISLKEDQQKVFFKVIPGKGCRRRWFKLCKAGVNIYRAC